MQNEDLTELAKRMAKDILEYKVVDEGFFTVYCNVYDRYKVKNLPRKSKFLVEVIHEFTVMGYDIDRVKPFRYKSYRD